MNCFNKVILASLAFGFTLNAAIAEGSRKGNRPENPADNEPMMMRPRSMPQGGGGGHGFGDLLRAAGPDAAITVEALADGVSVKITSKDAKVASRIKKAGEILRLSRELESEMPKPEDRKSDQ
ncbi:MAG: hypothetical protein AAB425_02585 [Bdellovibrionota bacterium]